MGLSTVLLLHVLLGWALMNGLAGKVVEQVGVLVETRLIEEIKPPQPPPPPSPPPKPAAKPAATPKPVVPPRPAVANPRQPVAAPDKRLDTRPELISTPVTSDAVAPAPVAPVAAVAAEPVAASSARAQPVPVAAGIVCSRTPPPQAPAVSSEVRGSIFVIGTLKAGRVVQVEVQRTTLKGVTDRRVLRAFVQAIETAMKEGYVCVGDDVQIRQEFYFDIR